MCAHNWKKYNDVWACIKCGLTRLPNGRIVFDKELINYKPERRKGESEDIK